MCYNSPEIQNKNIDFLNMANLRVGLNRGFWLI